MRVERLPAAILGVLGLLTVAALGMAPHPAGADPATSESSAALRRHIELSPFEPGPEFWNRVLATPAVPDDLLLLAQGALALESGSTDVARGRFEEARRANGGSPYPHYYLSVLALDAGDPWNAIEHLREAVRRKRDFAAAYRLLGAAYLETGAVQRAFSALRTVVALAPGVAAPHVDLGRAYLDHGRPEHAVIEFERARELDAEQLETLYLLATAKLYAGRTDQAFADFSAYVELASGRAGEEERVARARILL